MPHPLYFTQRHFSQSEIGGEVTCRNPEVQVREMLHEIFIPFNASHHADGIKPLFTECIILLEQHTSDVIKLGEMLIDKMKLIVTYIIDIAIFQCLDRFITFLLGKETFNGNNHITFFHKPGAYFLVVADIEATE
jgi:hypothetical protein